jgi:hypothetical protein
MIEVKSNRSFLPLAAFADVLVSPKEAYARVRDGSISLSGVLLTLFALGLLASVAQISTINAVLNLVAMKGHAIPPIARSLAYSALIFSPIFLVLKTLIVGYILWFGVVACTNEDVPVRSAIMAAGLTQSIVLVHTLVTNLILRFTGDFLHPTNAEIGLNYIFRQPGLAAALSVINPFTIWYAAVLLYGLHVVTLLGARKTLLAALPYGILSALLIAIQATFMRSGAL